MAYNGSITDPSMVRTWRAGSDEDCFRSQAEQNFQIEGDVHCNATWDTILCWPAARVGTVTFLPCPQLPGLDVTKHGFRRCGAEGRWEGKFPGDFSNPKGYTNYTNCYTPEAYDIWKKFYANKSSAQRQMIKDIVVGTRTMEIVGLWVSLVSSLISLFIFSYFRSLRCHRTRIHRNLFVSISVQTIVRLILYVDQFVAQAGGRSTIGTTGMSEGATIFETPVLCEFLYAMIEYTKTVQFMWMLIEGLYLHNMIAVSVFSGRPNYIVFYLMGWGVPLPFTIGWVTTMALSHTARCWFPYYFLPYYWIIEAPRVAVIAINLMFLLNIIRVLVIKLRRSQTNEPQVTKVRKAVKAALVLLPLLGITNFVVMTDPPADNVTKFGIWSYTTYFLVSFQGFLISLLYCFLNGEVQLTLRKRWERYRHSRVVQSASFRRLSRSFSVFTSITEVPNTTVNQNRRSSAVPISNGNVVPLLRGMIVRRESRM
ncbi:PDF receptor-like [Mizuhopecten yessoensis]|uniref:PDF receptor-like n=1 Tax=Mizuhopecten yessoensis TaxID=6573 RepID=UPI000B459053|nr:PDF receptor-like [Mizuhopecten yessoensis]